MVRSSIIDPFPWKTTTMGLAALPRSYALSLDEFPPPEDFAIQR